jgi:hypothetical protein
MKAIVLLLPRMKVEDAAIDIADFQRYVVEADGARLCGANHSTLLL